MGRVSTPRGYQPTTVLDELSDYMPLAAYALLALVASVRLYVHWPARKPAAEKPTMQTDNARGAVLRPQWCCRGKSSHPPSSATPKLAPPPLSSVFNAKFLFHLFLVLFSVCKVLQYVFLVLPLTSGDEDSDTGVRRVEREAATLCSGLSGCAYITLLLFLEMHWRDILSPQGSSRKAWACRSWAVFGIINAVLYATVGVAVGLEFTLSSDDDADLWWSNAVTDALLIIIAISYTLTALYLYRRVTKSLTVGSGKLKGTPGRSCKVLCGCLRANFNAQQDNSTLAPLLGSDGNGGDAIDPSTPGATVLEIHSSAINMRRSSPSGARTEASPLSPLSLTSYNTGIAESTQRADQQAVNLQGIDLLAADGTSTLQEHVAVLTTKSLSKVSRQQLLDALRVFIAIMLSSAFLILVRAILSFVYKSDADQEWWFSLVVLLGDVPPCIGYMILMYPRDDDAIVLAGQRFELASLFGKLLRVTTDQAEPLHVAIQTSAGRALPISSPSPKPSTSMSEGSGRYSTNKDPDSDSRISSLHSKSASPKLIELSERRTTVGAGVGPGAGTGTGTLLQGMAELPARKPSVQAVQLTPLLTAEELRNVQLCTAACISTADCFPSKVDGVVARPLKVPVRVCLLSFSVSGIRLPPKHLVASSKLLALTSVGGGIPSGSTRARSESRDGVDIPITQLRSGTSRRSYLSSSAAATAARTAAAGGRAVLPHSYVDAGSSFPLPVTSAVGIVIGQLGDKADSKQTFTRIRGTPSHSMRAGKQSLSPDLATSPQSSYGGSGLDKYRHIYSSSKPKQGAAQASPVDLAGSQRESTFKKHRRGQRTSAHVVSASDAADAAALQAARTIQVNPVGHLHTTSALHSTPVSPPSSERNTRGRSNSDAANQTAEPITNKAGKRLNRALKRSRKNAVNGLESATLDEYSLKSADTLYEQQEDEYNDDYDDDDDDDDDADDAQVVASVETSRRHRSTMVGGLQSSDTRHMPTRELSWVAHRNAKASGDSIVDSRMLRAASMAANFALNLHEMSQWECYMVVFVGTTDAAHTAADVRNLPDNLRHPRSHSFDEASNDATASITRFTWQYVGHTEPSTLECLRAVGSQSTESEAALTADDLIFSTSFGLSVPLPLALLDKAMRSSGATAVVRVQLRWYDGSDEEAVMRVGSKVHSDALPAFRMPDGSMVSVTSSSDAGNYDAIRFQVEDPDYLVNSWDVPAISLSHREALTLHARSVELVPAVVQNLVLSSPQAAESSEASSAPIQGVLSVTIDQILDVIPGVDMLPENLRHMVLSDASDATDVVTRTSDWAAYSYTLGLEMNCKVSSTDNDYTESVTQLAIPTCLRFSVLETTLESAFAGLVPRSVLPLILQRRAVQHRIFASSLVQYLEGLRAVGSMLPKARRAAGELAKVTPASAFSTLYGRLIGHLEREEEVKTAVFWLTSRCFSLKQYCTELVEVLTQVLAVDANLLPSEYAGAFRLKSSRAAQSMLTFRSSHLKKDRLTRFLPTNLHVQDLAISSSIHAEDIAALQVARLNEPPVGRSSTPPAISGGTPRELAAAWQRMFTELTDPGGPLDGNIHDVAPSATLLAQQECPLSKLSHSMVTVGAPSAHYYGFKAGQGLCAGAQKLLQLFCAPNMTSTSDLAANVALRDFEDAKLAIQCRADTVMSQGIAAVIASFTRALSDALLECYTSTTGEAVRTQSAYSSAIPLLHTLLDESLVEPMTKLLRCSSAAARLAHASSEGMRSLRQWLHCGFPIFWESLLSCWGKEHGMLDDLRLVAAALSLVDFCVVDADEQLDGARSALGLAQSSGAPESRSYPWSDASARPATPSVNDGRPQVLADQLCIMHKAEFVACASDFAGVVSRCRADATAHDSVCGLTVVIPVRRLRSLADRGVLPHELCRSLPCDTGECVLPTIQAVPLLFSQGINEAQQAANMTGSSLYQQSVNVENLRWLDQYTDNFVSFATTEGTALAAARERLRGDVQAAVFDALVVAAVRAGIRVTRAQGSFASPPPGTQRNPSPDPLCVFGTSTDYLQSPNRIGRDFWDSICARLLRVSGVTLPSDRPFSLDHIVDWFSPPEGSIAQHAAIHRGKCCVILKNAVAAGALDVAECVLRTLPLPARAVFSTFYAVDTLSTGRAIDPTSVVDLANTLFAWGSCPPSNTAFIDSAVLSELAASGHFLLPGILSGSSRSTLARNIFSSLHWYVTNDFPPGDTEPDVYTVGAPHGPPASELVFNTAAGHARRASGLVAANQRASFAESRRQVTHERSDTSSKFRRSDGFGIAVVNRSKSATGGAANLASIRIEEALETASVDSTQDASLPFGYGSLGSDGESEQAVFLRLVEDLARVLRGGRITSCKSAKDRTGMSITYEESRLLCQYEVATLAGIEAAVGASTATLSRFELLGEATGPLASEQILVSSLLTSPLRTLFDDHNVAIPSLPTWLYAAATSGHLHGPQERSLSPVVASAGCRAALTRVCLPWLTAPTHGLHHHWFRDYMKLASVFRQDADAPATGSSFFADMAAITCRLPSSFHVLLQGARSFLSHDALPLITHMETEGTGKEPKWRMVKAASMRLTTPDLALCSDPLVMANFMREWGSRLANTQKNTGAARFAFNHFQRRFFPPEYQCPTSVMGSGET
jgi:hypothetical protein